ncbi:hypothetical protein Tco_0579696 [Tanacetum coccineum]
MWLLRRPEVVRVVVCVGGGWQGSGDEGWFRLAAAGSGGTRWVMRGRWWVGGVEAAGMVMMAVGDGVRCGGVDGECGVAAAVGWLGWCEGGGEVAAMVMLVATWRLWGGWGRGAAARWWRGGEWVGGSGRSGEEEHNWSWPEDSPKNFSGGRRWWPAAAGRNNSPERWRGWRRKMMFVCVLYFVKMI